MTDETTETTPIPGELHAGRRALADLAVSAQALTVKFGGRATAAANLALVTLHLRDMPHDELQHVLELGMRLVNDFAAHEVRRGQA